MPAVRPEHLLGQTYLLLDSRNVESANNVGLTVGQVSKHQKNPLFAEDRLWEPRFDNLYPNVVFDPDQGLYRCWYSPFVIDTPSQTTTRAQRRGISMQEVRERLEAQSSYRREMGVCYAVSKDGLVWEKPSLEIYPWEGEKSNLLLLGPHGAGVLQDTADSDPQRRFKMLARTRDGSGHALAVAFSPDGLRFGPLKPILQGVRGDTHNNALWAPELKKYVAFTRQWPDELRAMFRTESSDFLDWSFPMEVLRGTSPGKQVYSMPVFRYHGVYLGLPAIFDLRTDRVQTELAWSPDTVHWERIAPGTPLIPLAEEKGAYDWGCTYAAASPVRVGREIRVYYSGSDGAHTDFRNGFFCMGTLRRDGFAGYRPLSAGGTGEILTTSLPWPGGPLTINADAEEGEVEVSVLSIRGKLLLRGTLSGRLIDAWINLQPQTGKRQDASRPKPGEPVRLRFELRRATLYSYHMRALIQK